MDAALRAHARGLIGQGLSAARTGRKPQSQADTVVPHDAVAPWVRWRNPHPLPDTAVTVEQGVAGPTCRGHAKRWWTEAVTPRPGSMPFILRALSLCSVASLR
jgi:hypothetical protein